MFKPLLALLIGVVLGMFAVYGAAKDIMAQAIMVLFLMGGVVLGAVVALYVLQNRAG